MHELIRYEAMCQAIAEAHQVDEVKSIRDKALALKMISRTEGARRQFAELTVRAERRCGELIREGQKEGTIATVGDFHGNQKTGVSSRTTHLADLNITRDQSSRFKKLADIPEKDFEEAISSSKEPPTTKGVLGMAKQDRRRTKSAQIEARKQEAVAALPNIGERYELYHGECREALKLPADSVDFIVTDPPYPEKYLPVFDDLSEVGAHVLKPGGLALVMVGQSYLPEVIERLSRHLTYHWTIAYLTPGGQAVQQFPRRVNAFWKPVLIYRIGEYTGDWFGDVTRSAVNDNDKDHHRWGQSVSGMRDLMRRFVRPNQVILDPFLGGGTTAVVALEMGARFIGYDKNQAALDTTRTRIGEIHAAVLS